MVRVAEGVWVVPGKTLPVGEPCSSEQDQCWDPCPLARASQAGSCGHVQGSISPTPRGVVCECHSDLASNIVTRNGFVGACSRDDRWDVPVCVRHPFGPLIQARTVSVDDVSS